MATLSVPVGTLSVPVGTLSVPVGTLSVPVGTLSVPGDPGVVSCPQEPCAVVMPCDVHEAYASTSFTQHLVQHHTASYSQSHCISAPFSQSHCILSIFFPVTLHLVNCAVTLCLLHLQGSLLCAVHCTMHCKFSS